MSAHSPAPWVADDNEGFSPWTIWSRMAPTGHGQPGPQVAIVVGDSSEAAANARLIAAAPDLLKALRDLLPLASEAVTQPGLCVEILDAHAAIAKATT